MVSTPHGPLANDRLTTSVFIEKLCNLGLDLIGRNRSNITLSCIVVTNFVFSEGSTAVHIDCVVEWNPFVELNIVLLDRRPVLPPAQLTVFIPIKVLEAPDEILLGDGCVREVTLDHHVILSHPLVVGHDSIVKDSLLDIAFALGMVPEPSNRFIVSIVPVMFVIIDDAISVPVTQCEIMVDEGLEAHVIVDNVVQAVQLGRGKLQVFPRVARIADLSFSVICGPALQEVKHIIIDHILIERSQFTLQIER